MQPFFYTSEYYLATIKAYRKTPVNQTLTGNTSNWRLKTIEGSKTNIIVAQLHDPPFLLNLQGGFLT